MNSRFYYSTFQLGADKAVKSEVLAEFPQLKFAFSRPGFMTFKETLQSPSQKPILQTHGIFSRLWGESLGQAKTIAEAQELLKLIPPQSIIHLFERDQFVPGDEPKTFVFNENIEAFSQKYSFRTSFRIDAAPQVNEPVYDLIWLDPGKAETDSPHLFLGKHVHQELLDPSPGNLPQFKLPEQCPSRAYLKMAEAIARFDPAAEAGMDVLEVGCSPGGASMALLNRKFKVTGIDPKRMDPIISANKNFTSIQALAGEVNAQELKHCNPRWIVMDMNIAPLEALDELSHVLTCLRKNHGRNLKLETGLLTLKLNDWKFSGSIPLYMKRLEECGFKNLFAKQLVHNRQEFFVYAQNFRT